MTQSAGRPVGIGVDRTLDVVTSTQTVVNTTDETTIFDTSLSADAIQAGEVINVEAYGVLSTANAADRVTIRLYIDGTLLSTLQTTAGQVDDEPWKLEAVITARSVGVTGELSTYVSMQVSGAETDLATEADTVDTTSSQTFSITAQWDAADIDNHLDLYQAFIRLHK